MQGSKIESDSNLAICVLVERTVVTTYCLVAHDLNQKNPTICKGERFSESWFSFRDSKFIDHCFNDYCFTSNWHH